MFSPPSFQATASKPHFHGMKDIHRRGGDYYDVNSVKK